MEALIIIDMQEAFIGHKRDNSDFGEVVEYINYSSSLFREAERPVIFVRDLSEGDGEEYLTIPELSKGEADYEVVKNHNNSFWETDLENILNELKVEMLVLAGSAAEYCVTATYFGAKERGFEPVFLQNGVLAETIEGYQAMVKTRASISFQPLKYILKNVKH